jgi:hypothetical protein
LEYVALFGAGLLDFGVDLVNPNFAATANGAGFFTGRVEDPG